MKPTILNPEQNQSLRIAEAEAKLFKLPDNWREDRERVNGITIDSKHTLDRDDAIWFEKRPDGFDVLVSIADIGYIPQASAIAHYAELMGETRYLRSRQIPMIPAKLSQNKLSLLETKDSPVFSAAISLGLEKEYQGMQLYRGHIRPLRITYPEVAKLTHGEGDKDMVATFRAYEAFALDLLRGRQNRGALAYYNADQGLMTDEDGVLLGVHEGVEHSGELIVQEFMIAANAAVARFGLENDVPLLYRNHIMAQDFNVEEVVELLQNGQIGSLTEMRRTMGRAFYSIEARGHDALQLPAYLHFTSPLRRFSDFVNHANLAAHFEDRAYPYPSERLSAIAERLNNIQNEINEAAKSPYKQKDRKISTKRLGATAAMLLALKENELFRVVKAAQATDEWTEGLYEALVTQMADGSVANRILLEALFVDTTDQVHSRLRQEIVNHLAKNTAQAAMIANEAQTQGRISGVAYKPDTAVVAGFGIIAEFTYNGGSYTGKADDRSRKVAQQKAFVEAVGNLCGAEVVWAESPTPVETLGNPRSALDEYCHRIGHPLSVFATRQEWADGVNALFTATVVISGQEFTGHGRKAREAEANAARAALATLDVGEAAVEEVQILGDPIGTLIRRSQALGVDEPRYDFVRTGSDNQPRFQFTVTAIDAVGDDRVFIGEEASKKQVAKASAAYAACKGLGL